jgi:hypothetical protein
MIQLDKYLSWHIRRLVNKLNKGNNYLFLDGMDIFSGTMELIL